MEKLCKLGIAMDYPARWNFQKILRDLIQNFYDSVGCDRFGHEVSYRYERQRNGFHLSLQTQGHPFDYDWLLYVGGSTKTGHPQYIGQYGEGFKICVLSLLQMHVDNIRMHSKDWLLTPCRYTERIDGRNVEMLGFRLQDVPDDGVTSLEVDGIPAQYERELREGPLYFFYPENELFGERLAGGTDRGYCVYGANDRSIPTWYVWDPEFRGILYVNHLARGRLDVPWYVNINNPDRSRETRERHVMDPGDVIRYLYLLALLCTPEEARTLLEGVEERWNDLPDRIYDSSTWYYIICELVRKVASSPEAAGEFLREHPDLAYLERPNSDRRHNQRVERAAAWARENSRKRLVNPIFRLLGAEDLVAACEQHGREGVRAADARERQLIGILYEALQAVAPAAVWEDIIAYGRPEEILVTDESRNSDGGDAAEKGNNISVGETIYEENAGMSRECSEGKTASEREDQRTRERLSSGKHQRDTDHRKSGNPAYADPLIEAERIPGGARRGGLRPHYRLNALIFDRNDFAVEAFDRSLVRLSDKVLHIYGSSRSERVNVLLTEYGAWLMEHAAELGGLRQKWVSSEKLCY